MSKLFFVLSVQLRNSAILSFSIQNGFGCSLSILRVMSGVLLKSLALCNLAPRSNLQPSVCLPVAGRLGEIRIGYRALWSIQKVHTINMGMILVCHCISLHPAVLYDCSLYRVPNTTPSGAPLLSPSSLSSILLPLPLSSPALSLLSLLLLYCH